MYAVFLHVKVSLIIIERSNGPLGCPENGLFVGKFEESETFEEVA
jgi:hypothetical protein